MKIYSFYIAKKLLKLFCVICVFLLFVIILFKVIDVLNDFNLSQNMGLRNIAKFALYLSPQMFIYIAPMALLCSLIYVHYSMFVDNELVILQSSGIGMWGMVKPIIMVATFLTVLSYAAVSFVIPYSKAKIVSQRQLVSRSILPKVITSKTFINISDKISMYINQKRGDKVEGLIIYDKRDINEDSVIIARNAQVNVYKDSILFTMYNGSRQAVQNNALQMVFFDTLALNIPFVQSTHGNDLSLELLDLPSLLEYKAQDSAQESDKIMELHKRLSWPLVSPVFVFIAISFLFTGRYHRTWDKGVLLRIVIVVALYMFLYFFLKNGVKAFKGFALMMYINSLIFIIASFCYLKYKSTFLNRLR